MGQVTFKTKTEEHGDYIIYRVEMYDNDVMIHDSASDESMGEALKYMEQFLKSSLDLFSTTYVKGN